MSIDGDVVEPLAGQGGEAAVQRDAQLFVQPVTGGKLQAVPEVRLARILEHLIRRNDPVLRRDESDLGTQVDRPGTGRIHEQAQQVKVGLESDPVPPGTGVKVLVVPALSIKDGSHVAFAVHREPVGTARARRLVLGAQLEGSLHRKQTVETVAREESALGTQVNPVLRDTDEGSLSERSTALDTYVPGTFHFLSMTGVDRSHQEQQRRKCRFKRMNVVIHTSAFSEGTQI